MLGISRAPGRLTDMPPIMPLQHGGGGHFPQLRVSGIAGALWFSRRTARELQDVQGFMVVVVIGPDRIGGDIDGRLDGGCREYDLMLEGRSLRPSNN